MRADRRAKDLERLHGEIIEIFQKLRGDGQENVAARTWDVLNAPHRTGPRGRRVEPQDLVELVLYLWKVRPSTRWVLYFPESDEVCDRVYDDYEEAVADANDAEAVIWRVDT